MTAHIYRLKGKEYTRRPRGGNPAGPVKPMRFTPRVGDILHALFLHTYLSTRQIHRLVAPAILTESDITKKLAHMRDHNLVSVPDGQRKSEGFKSSDLYYQITKKGVDALLAKKRITLDDALMWEKLLQNLSNDFFHDAAASYVAYSIHLGAIEQGKRFISKYEILAHPQCPPSAKEAGNPLVIPYTIDGKDRSIKADELCGVGDENNPPPIFTFIELDTGSESLAVIAGKAAGYDLMLGNRLHTRHLGFTEARVAFVTYGELRLQGVARKICSKASKTARHFRLKAAPEVDAYDQRPPLNGYMLIDAWKTPILRRVKDKNGEVKESCRS